MTIQEIEKALIQLIGEQNVTLALPQDFTSDLFAENILGFEEVDEAEMQSEADAASYQQSAQ